MTPAKPVDPWLIWKILAILSGIALIATVAGMPYLLAFAGEEITGSRQLWLLLPFLILFQFIPAPLAGALGLWLGNKVGLGAPMLRALLTGKGDFWRRFRVSLGLAILAGFVTGFALLILSPLVEPLFPEEMLTGATETIDRLTALKGLGGSFMAGVVEEMEFRLGLMTLLVWLGAVLVRRNPPPAGVVWTANVLAVLPFALLHLTNVHALGASITFGIIVYVVVANGLAGGVFGWLYWRHGIEAAMMAHFCTDIVLHVLPLLLIGLVPS